jgi:chemotaxis protein methyltransferase CheR
LLTHTVFSAAAARGAAGSLPGAGGAQESLGELIALVARQTGLSIREQDREQFARKIQRRLHSLGLDVREYRRLLEEESAAALAEWNALAVLLTIGESYFFRDSGQMSLLREVILPELLERKKESRVLRIWSAGCAGGEEPYSIAILLRELLPSPEDWQVTVLASDINPEAVERGRRGRYSEWAFRAADNALQERYFSRRDDGWEIKPSIRSMVSFSRCNLLTEPFPHPAVEMRDLDLIVCRNVFIYLEPCAVSAIVGKFAETLTEGGYLLTGHGELWLQSLERFAPMMVKEQIILRRVDAKAISRALAAPVAGGPLPCQASRRSQSRRGRGEQGSLARWRRGTLRRPELNAQSTLLAEMRGELTDGRYDAVVLKSARLIQAAPENLDALLLAAESHACRGEYEAAAATCREGIKLHPTSPQPYFALAQVCGATGEEEEAKKLLRKVLYLDPEHVAAYVELAAIHAAEGDAEPARRMASAAVLLLADLPAAAPVPPYQGVTAQELMSYMERMREEMGNRRGMAGGAR